MAEGPRKEEPTPALAETLPGRRDPIAFDATQPLPRLATVDKLAPGARLGERYTIVRLLGAGGMGEVYLARDEVLGKEVALKLVRPELAAVAGGALRAEVLLAQKVTHENVCRIYDLEEVDGRYLVKMEYVDGATLAERLTDGPLEVATALEYARGIAAGLAAAHAQGIVHRDLKPHNVLIERAGGRVVLMDFGLARAVRAPRDSDDGGSSGTPEYMAPEQARGGAVDARADLYSLGALLYHCLVGKVPFPEARERFTSGREIARDAPDPRAARPDLPPWLGRLIRRLLERDPARRPSSAREVAAALAGPSRRWMAVAAIAAALVAALAGAVAALHAHRARAWQPHLVELPAWDENADMPSFSPDGRRIAYLSDRDGAWRIYVEPIAPPGASRPITPAELDGAALDPDLPRWSRDGKSILFVGGRDTAWRVPVEGGAPVKVVEHVAQADECGEGRLALVRLSSESGPRLVVRGPGDAERELLRLPASEAIDYLRCDARGAQIVLTRAQADSHKVQRSGEIVLVTLDGPRDKMVRSLTRAADEARYPPYPTFAPDGKSIIYAASRGGPTNLWEIAVAGGAPVQLTSGAGPDLAPSVSPDGKLLVFDSDDTAVPVFAVRDGARRRIAPTLDDVATLAAAPDGSELVASVRGSGGREIAAVPLGDGDRRKIADGDTPALTPDGDTVAWSVADGGATRLYAAPRTGGAPREIATVPGRVLDLRAAADGTLHLSRTGDQGLEAWRVPLAGGAPEREAPAPFALVVPAPRGGWRVAVAASAGTVRTGVVVPPGRPLALDPSLRTVELRLVAWDASGASFVYWDGAALHRFTVGTGEDRPLGAEKDLEGLAVSPDGATLYVSSAVGHVRRHLVDNFADRPRPR